MRVMVLAKATKDSEAGTMPSTELFEAMGKYNEELINAGIMLAGEGLKPSAQGKRIAFDGPSRTVIDGPFAETRELVAGFWLWQVKRSKSARSTKWMTSPRPSHRSSPNRKTGFAIGWRAADAPPDAGAQPSPVVPDRSKLTPMP